MAIKITYDSKLDVEKFRKDLFKKGKGFRHIGEGAFASVYGSPSSKLAYKIGRSLDGWVDWVKGIKKQGGSSAGEHLPDVKWVIINRRRRSYVACMERLHWFQSGEQADFLSNWFDAIFSLYRRQKPSKARETIKKLLDVSELVCRIKRKSGAQYDIHNENIMFRPSDKKWVLIDPLA